MFLLHQGSLSALMIVMGYEIGSGDIAHWNDTLCLCIKTTVNNALAPCYSHYKSGGKVL